MALASCSFGQIHATPLCYELVYRDPCSHNASDLLLLDELIVLQAAQKIPEMLRLGSRTRISPCDTRVVWLQSRILGTIFFRGMNRLWFYVYVEDPWAGDGVIQGLDDTLLCIGIRHVGRLAQDLPGRSTGFIHELDLDPRLGYVRLDNRFFIRGQQGWDMPDRIVKIIRFHAEMGWHF